MGLKTAIIIGAGSRGAKVYAPYALEHPNELKIVAVAEPNRERLLKVKEAHDLSDEKCYRSWEEAFQEEAVADIAIICTQDKHHFEPTMKALELGYDVLLEKPMSPDPLECIELEKAAKRYDRQLTIGHVLRYTPFWQAVKKK